MKDEIPFLPPSPSFNWVVYVQEYLLCFILVLLEIRRHFFSIEVSFVSYIVDVSKFFLFLLNVKSLICNTTTNFLRGLKFSKYYTLFSFIRTFVSFFNKKIFYNKKEW